MRFLLPPPCGEVARQRRAGGGPMRARLKPGMKENARDMRLKPTDAERKLWYKLRELNAQGYHFRRQAPFRSYILDFVEHSAKIVIELDGSQHGLPGQSRKDEIRDQTLARENYRVLRFFNSDVNENIEGVVEAIARQLTPTPHPPRSARRPPHKGEVKKTLPRKGLRAPPKKGERSELSS